MTESVTIPKIENHASIAEAKALLETVQPTLTGHNLTLLDQTRLEETLTKLVDSSKATITDLSFKLQETAQDKGAITEEISSLNSKLEQITSFLEELRKTNILKQQVLEKLNKALP
jgi:uncharacterized protein YaaN involved in tellurite resistance